MKAVYVQSTKNHELEYKLVELTTIREAFLQEFKDLERAVMEKRRKFDDESILEGMKLLNNVREITFDLLEQVAEWQKMFVKAKRPTIMNCDYLIEMIRSTEFIGSSPIRKYFNFAVMRRNIFILPLSTGKPKDTVETSKEMIRAIEKFANPDMDRLIYSYQLLQKCLSGKDFKSLMSLDRWAFSLWQPNVTKYPSLPPLQQRQTSKSNLFQRQASGTSLNKPQKSITKDTSELSSTHPPPPSTHDTNSAPTDPVPTPVSVSTDVPQSDNISVTSEHITQSKTQIVENNPSTTSHPPLEMPLSSSATSLSGASSVVSDSSTVQSQLTSSTFHHTDPGTSKQELSKDLKAKTMPPLVAGPHNAVSSKTTATIKKKAKKSLNIDTAVAPAFSEGRLVTPSSSVNSSAIPSPTKSTKEVNASKVFSEASISTFGGGAPDGPGGFMSTAQLREWYQANAPAQNEDSDEDW